MNPLYPNQDRNYQVMPVRSVSPASIARLLNGSKENCQFGDYIQNRMVMQWGGLSDPFDLYEKKYRIGLECLKLFQAKNYPLCFSTKGTWWTEDPEYVELFQRQTNWNVKVSIINLDPKLSNLIECGTPSPRDRLQAIHRISGFSCGGATLRLRPFIIGMSDLRDEYLDLIADAYKNGARAVSTEFFCLEGRAHGGTKARYDKMSEALGFDILAFYRRYSPGMCGYLRLNYKIKEPYMLKMKKLCDKLGMRFYVSDAHWKHLCANGSCCGLNKEWNYFRGQYTELLHLAQRRPTGEVNWDDMEPHLEMFKKFLYRHAQGFNTIGTRVRTKFWKHTMYDWLKMIWNDPQNGKNPYQYFYGLLRPVRKDSNGNLVYKFHEYT